ncbi:MAG TPA: hypothetical protein VGG48_11085 [Rhizomicrobium sp.]|jgi:hypothetical protein
MTRRNSNRLMLAGFVLFGAFIAAFVAFPRLTVLVGATLGQFNDPGPPKLIKSIGCVDRCNAASIATLVQTRFPVGTKLTDMETELGKDGFTPEDPMPAKCTPKDKMVPGKWAVACPAWDPHWNPANRAAYRWSKTVGCGNNILIDWSADKAGRLTHVEGSYYYACV